VRDFVGGERGEEREREGEEGLELVRAFERVLERVWCKRVFKREREGLELVRAFGRVLERVWCKRDLKRVCTTCLEKEKYYRRGSTEKRRRKAEKNLPLERSVVSTAVVVKKIKYNLRASKFICYTNDYVNCRFAVLIMMLLACIRN